MRILIIGSGVAGLTSAILADQQGYDVTVLTKTDDILNCNSRYAQGGIVYTADADSPGKLYNDIVSAGAGMTLPSAARLVADEGPSILKEILLDKVKVPFKQKDGKYLLTGEGAHSLKRILYSGDNTGEVIVKSLVNYINEHTAVKIKSSHMVLDLITMPHHSENVLSVYDSNQCMGAYVLNRKSGVVEKYFAEKVIMATGGIGQLYKYTTNPDLATGDGIALAKRAGARIVNMEYTQFHPTTLAIKESGNFLISEAVRGEGAILLNKFGKDFMSKIDKRGSLAPRDVVSRAIVNEIERCGSDYVYLSLESIKTDKIEKRFPHIFKKCLDYSLDIRKSPIPVVPAFHFSGGGILTDLNGLTSIPGLYAVGEAACTGLHGANRLASTSLLEAVVFSKKSIEHISKNKYDISNREAEIREWQNPIGAVEEVDSLLINQDWELLKTIMWNYVGITRRKILLSRARERLYAMMDEVDTQYRQSKIGSLLPEYRNAVTTGILITDGALKNAISAGCHYRLD